MTARTAHCACGALRVETRGDPATAIAVCNCVECQRRTGSAFGFSGYWREEDVTVAGESRAWQRRSDAGRNIEFRFCETCGGTVWWRAEFLPGQIGVALGMFADPDAFAPQIALWTRSRHAWLDGETSLPSCEKGRG